VTSEEEMARQPALSSRFVELTESEEEPQPEVEEEEVEEVEVRRGCVTPRRAHTLMGMGSCLDQIKCAITCLLF